MVIKLTKVKRKKDNKTEIVISRPKKLSLKKARIKDKKKT